jgi:hypothetical protein
MDATLSRKALEEALKAAGSAHHDYEQNALGGTRDEHWTGFYSAYVLGRLGDFVTTSVLVGLLEDAPEDGDWAVSAAEYILDNLS